MTKYKMVCRHCQSDNVTQVCDARWNLDSQQWEVSDTWNNYYCQECDGETRIDRAETNEVTA